VLELEGDGRRPRRLQSNRDSLVALAAFLEGQGRVPDLVEVTAADVRRFLAQVHRTGRPATANTGFRGLHRFLKWLPEEEMDGAEASPMARMSPPKFKLDPPALLTLDDLRRLLRAWEGRGLAERRDTALIYFLIDTGARRGEVEAMRVGDVDLRAKTAALKGKTGGRTVALGRKTAAAVDRSWTISSGAPWPPPLSLDFGRRLRPPLDLHDAVSNPPSAIPRRCRSPSRIRWSLSRIKRSDSTGPVVRPGGQRGAEAGGGHQ
jgi:integrase/recombinase XerD